MLIMADAAKVRHKQTASLQAYDYYLLASELHFRADGEVRPDRWFGPPSGKVAFVGQRLPPTLANPISRNQSEHATGFPQPCGFRDYDPPAGDRDRGTPRGATPPTPPGIRVGTTAVRSG
jgi:hypothetical protein